MKTFPFGTMPDGTDVRKVILENGTVRCALITYGAAVISLEVPDRDGRLTDVVLGFDSLDAYMAQDKYMGAIIGRYANRIGGSRFALGGQEYALFPNEEPNHLHGGKSGFDKRAVWDVEEIPNGARFSLTSPHMDEGYPGKLDVTVDYVLEESALTILYKAKSDRDTVCNLTNHAYFNLGGHSSGHIGSHRLKLFSSGYTPVSDSASIPDGEIAGVAGTPMDFREPTEIGARIDDDFSQLRFTSGYDHNWVIDGDLGALRPAAVAFCPATGITMALDTTLPGIQFYSGNFTGGAPAGKGGAVYKNRDGFCLETQFYPDTPNKPGFPSCVLPAGEAWAHTTVFRFSVN